MGTLRVSRCCLALFILAFIRVCLLLLLLLLLLLCLLLFSCAVPISRRPNVSSSKADANSNDDEQRWVMRRLLCVAVWRFV
jgi:hypothetical protein